MIGDKIKYLRKKAGLTLDDVAKKTSVSKPTLIKMEKGKVVHLDKLRLVCALFNKGVDVKMVRMSKRTK